MEGPFGGEKAASRVGDEQAPRLIVDGPTKEVVGPGVPHVEDQLGVEYPYVDQPLLRAGRPGRAGRGGQRDGQGEYPGPVVRWER
jgi:hypothetical protein